MCFSLADDQRPLDLSSGLKFNTQVYEFTSQDVTLIPAIKSDKVLSIGSNFGNLSKVYDLE